MNYELFNKAQSLYDAKDFQGALMAFTQCLQDEAMPPAPGETGRLYHQIGNCLIKLRDANEAIQAYTQAVADPAYDMKGAVDCNLGMAYASLHDYDNAVRYFEAAVADEGYDARYKAYIGMGNAYMKVGKTAEAGVAFREAALDEGNPDPTKALLNLGVCFMALNRPADAVASYESAFQFDMPQAMKNKLNANLGQAYVACGEMAKAVTAFESAIADKTYYLSDSASVDYQRAVGAVAQGTSSQPTQVLAPVDMSGFDVVADGTAVYPEAESYPAETVPQDPYYYDDGPMEGVPGYPEAYADGNDDRFFTASDEELEQWSRGIAKQERKRRNVGLKIVVAIIIVIILHPRLRLPDAGKRREGAAREPVRLRCPVLEGRRGRRFAHGSDSDRLLRRGARCRQVDEQLDRLREGDLRSGWGSAVQDFDGSRPHRLEDIERRALFPQPKLAISRALGAWE